MTISIIIPSYNRGNLALQRANELLPYLSEDVDLWILNNASTEYVDDYNSLRNIENPYFHYIENEKNIGGNPNFMKGYSICDGDYGLFTSDEDAIIGENLIHYVRLLKVNPDVTFMKARGKGYNFTDMQVADAGIDAVKLTFQRNNYLSGSIYNRKVLTPEIIKIYDEAYGTDNMAYHYYNHLFWTDFCALRGKCVFCNIALIFETEGNHAAEEKKRILTDDIYVNNLEYTSYKSRINQFYGFVDEISDLGCDENIIQEMLRELIGKYGMLIGFLKDEYIRRNLDFGAVKTMMRQDMKDYIYASPIELNEGEKSWINSLIDAAAERM
ncbi:MAG: glycosyltransferase [Catonella sp.]|nr:glycosyltransferase [Catonella sp.]